MTTELYWLTLTTLMTALFWLPYILNRIKVRGPMTAMGNTTSSSLSHDPWAERAMKAHINAVENLVIFAPLVLTAHVLGISTSLTAIAALIYFFARLAHFIIQTAGIPVLRTLSFAVGMVCQLIFAFSILGWV